MSAAAASPSTSSEARPRGAEKGANAPFFLSRKPEMNLNQNHFELFGLPARFRDESRKIYENLQGQLDQGSDDEAASEATRMLMFYEKLAGEIDDKLAELET